MPEITNNKSNNTNNNNNITNNVDKKGITKIKFRLKLNNNSNNNNYLYKSKSYDQQNCTFSKYQSFYVHLNKTNANSMGNSTINRYKSI